MENSFFDRGELVQVESPNGMPWWHSAPLPGGQRIRGAHLDADRQFKMWEAIVPGDLSGKQVLDIGANDGFFSVAASQAGGTVTSINAEGWHGWPENINFLANCWNAPLTVVTGDFRTYPFDRKYDVILFLGVIYHVENVFSCMLRLKSILAQGGRIYLETHLSPLGGDTPVWEAASDLFPTSAPQGKQGLGRVGLSNFLLPNVNAVVNLVDTYGMTCETLLDNDYCREDPTRGMFVVY